MLGHCGTHGFLYWLPVWRRVGKKSSRRIQRLALAQAHKYSAAIAKGEVLNLPKPWMRCKPSYSQTMWDAVLCGFFMIVMIVMIFGTIRALRTVSLASDKPTVVEGEAIYEDPKPLNISALTLVKINRLTLILCNSCFTKPRRQIEGESHE